MADNNFDYLTIYVSTISSLLLAIVTICAWFIRKLYNNYETLRDKVQKHEGWHEGHGD